MKRRLLNAGAVVSLVLCLALLTLWLRTYFVKDAYFLAPRGAEQLLVFTYRGAPVKARGRLSN